MSGEVRLLDEYGETRRLVLALETLVTSVSLEHFALIGGLAVVARLGQVQADLSESAELFVVLAARPALTGPSETRRVPAPSHGVT